jgi:hypothetical protein
MSSRTTITFYTNTFTANHAKYDSLTVYFPTDELTIDKARALVPNLTSLKADTDLASFVHGGEGDDRKLELRKLRSSKEAAAHFSLLAWSRFPDDVHKAANIRTTKELVDKNTTFLKVTLLVYSAQRCLDQSRPAAKTPLTSFQSLSIHVARSPHLLELVFQRIDEHKKGRLDIALLGREVMDANPYIKEVDDIRSSDKGGVELSVIRGQRVVEQEPKRATKVGKRNQSRKVPLKVDQMEEEEEGDGKEEKGEGKEEVGEEEDGEEEDEGEKEEGGNAKKRKEELEWMSYDLLWKIEANRELIVEAATRWEKVMAYVNLRPDGKYQLNWEDNEEAVVQLTNGQLDQLGLRSRLWPVPSSSSSSSSSSAARHVPMSEEEYEQWLAFKASRGPNKQKKNSAKQLKKKLQKKKAVDKDETQLDRAASTPDDGQGDSMEDEDAGNGVMDL